MCNLNNLCLHPKCVCYCSRWNAPLHNAFFSYFKQPLFFIQTHYYISFYVNEILLCHDPPENCGAEQKAKKREGRLLYEVILGGKMYLDLLSPGKLNFFWHAQSVTMWISKNGNVNQSVPFSGFVLVQYCISFKHTVSFFSTNFVIHVHFITSLLT